jgi:hypothetical protein
MREGVSRQRHPSHHGKAAHSPAATAIAAHTISALASMVIMEVETDRCTVGFRQSLRRQDHFGRSNVGALPREAQNGRRISIDDAQVMRDEKGRDRLFLLESAKCRIQRFLAGSINACCRFVEEEDVGLPDQRKRDQQALKLAS